MLYYVVTSMDMAIWSDHTPFAPAVSLVMAPRWGSMLIVYTFLAALLDAHTHSLTRAHMPTHTHEPCYSRRSRQIDRQTTGSGNW